MRLKSLTHAITFCHHSIGKSCDAKQCSLGPIFLSHPHTHDRFLKFNSFPSFEFLPRRCVPHGSFDNLVCFRCLVALFILLLYLHPIYFHRKDSKADGGNICVSCMGAGYSIWTARYSKITTFEPHCSSKNGFYHIGLL